MLPDNRNGRLLFRLQPLIAKTYASVELKLAIEKGYKELRNIAKVLIPKLKVQINHGKTTFSVETSS